MATTTTTSGRPAAAPAGGGGLLGALRRPWPERRAERLLGAVAGSVLLVVGAIFVFVFVNAWPSFEANGLGWFGEPAGGLSVDQQIADIVASGSAGQPVYEIGTFPLLWATFLTTAFAVLAGLVIATLAAVFLVEFAPPRVRSVLEPVVTLLAAVPSVVYGLIGILAVVPLVADLISEERRQSVAGVIALTGEGWLVAALILMMMIVPIMVALIAQALRQVPATWKEGAAALGVNRWRVVVTISVRTARPAIIAAAVLATARALGEAIMLAMVSGSIGFAPNPIDGLTFLFEPARPLAATIVTYSGEGLNVEAFRRTLYAFAAVLLVSAIALSLAGYAAKQPLKKYGIRA